MTNEQLIIADAIVARLKASDYTEAERRLFVVFQLKDYKERRITVVPLGYELKPESRAFDKMTQIVQIGIQKILSGKDPDTEIAALIDVERDIVKKFNRLVDFSTLKAKVIDIENAPTFDSLMIQESNLFTGIITLTIEMLIPAEVQSV